MLSKRQEKAVDWKVKNIGKPKNIDFRVYEQDNVTHRTMY